MTGSADAGSRTSGYAPKSTSTSLLALVKAGDPAAWGRLVDLYGPLVYGWCRGSGLQAEDAADIGQEVFTAVASAIGEFRRERPGDAHAGAVRREVRLEERSELGVEWRGCDCRSGYMVSANSARSAGTKAQAREAGDQA